MNSSRAQTDEWLRRLDEARSSLQEKWVQQLDACAPPAFAELIRSLTTSLLADQDSVRQLQARFYREQFDLWLEVLGKKTQPEAAQTLDRDPRFSAPEWRELPWFDYLRRSYAVSARWLHDLLETVRADEATRRKLRFYGRQFIDAAAPSNCALTNPEVIKLALATQGESLASGLKNLEADADKGRVSMTDETAFEVGRNLALTPGAVIYQNDLIQLIQYRPASATVQSRPLLIVPPFINKYYILDLQPENSFVRHAVESGVTVFIVSWRNVPASLGRLTWDDYIEHGAISAIEVVRDLHARRKINALGFCVGGTLLACALAVLARRKRRPVASLTLLAAMLDFCDPGDIRVYIDEAYVKRCEHELGHGGVFPGSRLAAAFASLRPNDLVWRYVVNNYLKGRTPPAFDLLYWNSDSANLPGPLYVYYLRTMYLENALRQPDKLTMCGAPVDLGRIDVPTYVLATAEDHIVPWRAAYAGTRLLGKDVTFVRAASGHIAGVISPPHHHRRSYRTGPLEPDSDAWLAHSAEYEGSWWPHWRDWIKPHAGKRVPAPKQLGSVRYPERERAPGSYVVERSR